MSNQFILVLLIFCVAVSNVYTRKLSLDDLLLTKSAEVCQTPNNDTGYCVEIQKCPKFLNSDATNRDFINKSWCGPENEDPKQPKICCGKYVNYINEEICGNQTFLLTKRVYGGTESALGEYPWLARLKHRRKKGLETFGCVGFLVSERFVVTAAHCVRSKRLDSLGSIYQVQLGEHDIERCPDCTKLGSKTICSEQPQVLRAAKPIVHPGYQEDSIQHYHDIAVIPLKEPARFSQFVYPICLPEKHFQVNEYWISGWGKTETRRSSPIKLKVSLTTANRSLCIENYQRVEVEILDSQMCAGGEEGRDSCSGDSGGPLMARDGLKPWHAVGIVSFGLGCGLEGWPGIYTDLPHYYPWIKKVMKRYLRKHGFHSDSVFPHGNQ